MQVSLDSFWQKGLFPVPCNDSVHQEIFNAQPGLNTNLFFSPLIQFLEREGEAAKQKREVTTQVAFTAEHTSHLSMSPTIGLNLNLPFVQHSR